MKLTGGFITAVVFEVRARCARADAVSAFRVDPRRRVALDVLDALLANAGLWNLW